MAQQNHSLVPKTLSAATELPTMVQAEIVAGFQQVEGETNNEQFPNIEKTNLTQNTLVYNKTNGKYQLYNNGTGETNDPSSWKEVEVLTKFKASEKSKYSTGNIVLENIGENEIDNIRLFRATTNEATNKNPHEETNHWTPLTQIIKTGTSKLETGKQTPNIGNSFLSTGLKIIPITTQTYTVGPANKNKGVTLLLRNRRTSTNIEKRGTTPYQCTIEFTDQENGSINLYKRNDYVRMVSDGTQWTLNGGNSARTPGSYGRYRTKIRRKDQHIDALYFGEYGTDNFIRMFHRYIFESGYIVQISTEQYNSSLEEDLTADPLQYKYKKTINEAIDANLSD